MAELLEQVINGLILGGIYALIAVGYTMVYGIIQLINFAHGEIFMFGAYFAFLCVTTFGLPFWVALPISMLLCATMGMLIDFIAYRPLRNAPRLSALITAIGISLVLQNLARMIWGAEWRVFPSRNHTDFSDREFHSVARGRPTPISRYVYSRTGSHLNGGIKPNYLLNENRQSDAGVCPEQSCGTPDGNQHKLGHFGDFRHWLCTRSGCGCHGRSAGGD